MKNKKMFNVFFIVSLTLSILLFLLMIYFAIFPYILSFKCKEEFGCMNESGIYIIVSLMILPLFLLFFSILVFLIIFYNKNYSIYSNKKHIGKLVHVVMDRPIGTRHPKHHDMIYPINYGYIPDLIGGDGEEQDVYVLGEDKPLETFDGKIIAVIYRYNDNETKWVACKENEHYSKDQIKELTHFQEKYYKIKIITK